MTDLTEKDQVRLLISDVGGEDGETFLFSDSEINTFLLMESDVYCAASLALRTIAGNEAQLLKAITVLELETRGDKVAKALSDLADKLDAKSDEGYEPDFAEIGASLFARRELRAQRPERAEAGEEE